MAHSVPIPAPKLFSGSSYSSSSKFRRLFSFQTSKLKLKLLRKQPLFLSLSLSSSGYQTPHVSTAPVEYAPAPNSDFDKEIARLLLLRTRISNSPTLEDKIRVLDRDSRVIEFFHTHHNHTFLQILNSLHLDTFDIFLLKCLVAAGQRHVLQFSEVDSVSPKFESEKSSLKQDFSVLVNMIERWDASDSHGSENSQKPGEYSVDDVELKKLLKILGEVEIFYDCIGGIIGYQIVVLELLSASKLQVLARDSCLDLDASMKCQFKEIHAPRGLDLSKDPEYASQAALWGIEGLEELGEIYPLGGSGDRLGLVDKDTGECLPAAMLPYCGRTLLEGLIRDLQAREFLYYKLYGKQCITPVAIMTSSAKNNHEHIMALCERLGWFGRGRLHFQIFEQPLVPAIAAEDGRWLIKKSLKALCKPGGHGVIWKLAHDKGIFQWFYGHGRKAATVRQISNVAAATDLTLLALSGIGLHHEKKLGFASCKREIGATEGINVLIEKNDLTGRWMYGLTCIEYTEFRKFGITDSLQDQFPANTNILYVDLASAEKVGSSKDVSCLPGMVLNLMKPVTYVDDLGIQHSIPGGRLECTMQNIADHFVNTYSSRYYVGVEDFMDSFIVFNERKKVTSSAKRKRKHKDKSLHQTPDGSLLDIIWNAVDLLSQCEIKIPQIENNSKYIHTGPPFLILLHPSLGPLWEVTRQKFHGGSISEGSELQIEVAEFSWRNVQLDGSLIVVAENIIGSTQIHENEPILQYGNRCGRCKLKNVKVLNEGIDWNFADNVYWKNDIKRFQALKIILHGNAEFEATDVTLQGNHVYEVPSGYRLHVTTGDSGLLTKLDPIRREMMDSGSWFWKYKLKGRHIHLEIVEFSCKSKEP